DETERLPGGLVERGPVPGRLDGGLSLELVVQAEGRRLQAVGGAEPELPAYRAAALVKHEAGPQLLLLEESLEARIRDRQAAVEPEPPDALRILAQQGPLADSARPVHAP